MRTKKAALTEEKKRALHVLIKFAEHNFGQFLSFVNDNNAVSKYLDHVKSIIDDVLVTAIYTAKVQLADGSWVIGTVEADSRADAVYEFSHSQIVTINGFEQRIVKINYRSIKKSPPHSEETSTPYVDLVPGEMGTKIMTFLVSDPQFDRLITGNIETTKQHVLALCESLDELADGEDFTITICRKDMTPEEIESAPII